MTDASGNNYSFYGWAASFTYENVSLVGQLQAGTQAAQMAGVPVPSGSGDLVWGSIGWQQQSYSSGVSNLTMRQQNQPNADYPNFIAGDVSYQSNAYILLNGAVNSAQVGLNLMSNIASSGSVAHDATGVGGVENNTASSFSFNHTATAGAYVVVYVSVSGNTNTATGCTYDGTAMTLLGSAFPHNNSVYGYFCCFGLANVAGGTKSVVVTLSTTTYAVANSVSYTNVGSAATAPTIWDSSAVAKLAVSSVSGQMVVQAFGGYALFGSNWQSLSGGSNRYNAGSTNKEAILAISDTTSSATFSVSNSTTAQWASMAVFLNPPTTRPLP